MSLTPSLVAERTSGTAPLFVFCDASATTSSETTEPFFGIYYKWDFGDGGAGTWSYGNPTLNSRNQAFGPLAGHVFETPGTYIITLTCFDGVTRTDTTQSITVTNPDTTFSGTNTVCASTSGNFAGKPAGATEVTSSDFDSVLTTHYGTGKRILFRVGETFTSSAKSTLDQDTFTIGAFPVGTGQALVNHTFNGACIQVSQGGTPNVTDGRIMDLDINGNNGTSSTGIAFEAHCNRITMLNLDIRNVQTGFGASDTSLDVYGHVMWREICMANCLIDHIINAGYGIYCSTKKSCFLGNSVDDVLNGQATTRWPYAYKMVLANNFISRAGTAKSLIKMHAAEWNSGTVAFDDENGFTELIIFADNKLVGASAQDYLTYLGAQGDASDERVRNLLWERNWTVFSTNNVLEIASEGSSTVCRNNLIDTSGRSGWEFAVVLGKGVLTPTPTDDRVYHNTYFASNTGIDWVAIDIRHGSGHLCRNNLGYAPSKTSPQLTGQVVGTTESNNSTDAQVDATSPNFASGSPSVPDDFKITTGSYAIGAGFDGTKVFDDYFGNIRDWQTPNTDIGFHAFTTGSLPAAGGSAIAFDSGGKRGARMIGLVPQGYR